MNKKILIFAVALIFLISSIGIADAWCFLGIGNTCVKGKRIINIGKEISNAAQEEAKPIAEQAKVKQVLTENVETDGKECIDSDGGVNYYVKGYVEMIDEPSWGDNGRKYDYCWDDQEHLQEYVCENGVYVGDISYLCLNGCEDGACVSLPPEPSECGNQVCEGSEFVTCSNDCFYNIQHPLTIYDVVYYPATQGPGSDYLLFKILNNGEALDLFEETGDGLIAKYRVTFVGNGQSCNVGNFGFLSKWFGNVNDLLVLPQGVTEISISGSGTAPLFAEARHCDNLFRIGIFKTPNLNQCPEENIPYLALTNTILKCE